MSPNATGGQFCTFRLGKLYFGIAVLTVQEVLYNPEVTVVPTADIAVEGLVNLRGQIATAIDLRRRLNLPPRQPDVQPVHVVVSSGGDPVTLLVDQIGDVISVESDIYEPAPSTIDGPARDLILGVYKLETELLAVLDVAKTVDLEATLIGSMRDHVAGDLGDQAHASI